MAYKIRDTCYSPHVAILKKRDRSSSTASCVYVCVLMKNEGDRRGKWQCIQIASVLLSAIMPLASLDISCDIRFHEGNTINT